MTKLGIGLIGLSALYMYLQGTADQQAALVLTGAAVFYVILSLIVLR